LSGEHATEAVSSVEPLAHGVVLAVGLIVALGPQNVFVFQQGAAQPRFRRALPTVATAGLSDTLLVSLAVVGVSLAVLRYPGVQRALFGVGALFLVFVGWSVYRSPTLSVEGGEALSVGEQVGFTASVSLLNPHAILDTVGVIGTSALGYTGEKRWLFAGGVVAVSWCWFVGLAASGRLLGRSESTAAEAVLARLDTFSAVVIWAVAGYMAWRFVGFDVGGG
jgi:L-lysine exporter family protein LysE/ArgO